MSRKYMVVNEDFLKEHDLQQHANLYSEWTSYVVFTEDNKSYTVVGCDGGEPEDQILTRDWNWVVHALQEAYDAGVGDARSDTKESK